ncbi:Glutathione S-transferase omega 3, partial [Operophtera brumata]
MNPYGHRVLLILEAKKVKYELIKGSLECFDTNFAFGSEQIMQTLDILEKEYKLLRRQPARHAGLHDLAVGGAPLPTAL